VDDVPRVPFAEIKRVIDEDLPAETFARIDEQPLATASIAQIHAALLKNGRDVIIKVRRPGVVEQIGIDLNLLRSTAELLERRSERAQLLEAHVTERVLVLERIEGKKLDENHGVAPDRARELARHFFSAYVQ
jgi:predicted unusual protein kinase regulating ubiquinone biosynthesis (AarF/ABC1/UbiB family)